MTSVEINVVMMNVDLEYQSLLVKALASIAICVLPFFASAGAGEGQELYNAYCQICHGESGEGQTMGKPLTDGMANRLSGDDLLAVITDGRAGTGMVAWGGSFSDEEIFDIASHVRVLQGKPGLDLVTDDSGIGDNPQALAGAEIFNGAAGCSTCHSYDDQGGNVGPALDGVSSRLSKDALLQALINPSATIANGYGAKVVTQVDGTRIRGRYRNDSELAVQIQSADGRLWVTYFKDRVRSVTDSDESLMPDVFATLGAEQQQQLLAFLHSL